MPVPDWLRIHAMTSLSTSVTMNMRSASLRCAMEMIEMRGLPSGVNSSRCASSGSPCIHVAKPGEAMRLLICIASLRRSFAGKKVSRSKAPNLSKAGFCTAWMRPVMSSDSPARHAPSRMLASRMCSREPMGSASMPSRLSRPETTDPMRSRSAPASANNSGEGGENDRSTDNGSPVSAPGV